MRLPALCAGLLLSAAFTAASSAHDITAKSDDKIPPAFDITKAEALTDGRLAEFAMEVTGEIGSAKPQATGQLKGAKVEAYVWPTRIDPEAVGFAKGSGILALAVTAHPDFDDTPLYDENNDGDPANDGAGWHSHWVVLGEDKACGAGLKVRDVSPAATCCPRPRPDCRSHSTVRACRRC